MSELWLVSPVARRQSALIHLQLNTAGHIQYIYSEEAPRCLHWQGSQVVQSRCGLANEFLMNFQTRDWSANSFRCLVSIQLDRGVEILKIPSLCVLLPAQINQSVAPSDIHCCCCHCLLNIDWCLGGVLQCGVWCC